MRSPSSPNPYVERVTTGFLGASFLASAALAAGLAQDEMALTGVVCGLGQAPHCGWCYGAVSLALAGFTALALAVRPVARRRAAV